MMNSSSMPTIVSADLKITGDLVCDGDIQVDGSIEGSVNSRTLTIGEHGSVAGDVTAQQVTVDGTLKGKIHAQQVTLSRSASVTADIEFQSLGIEEGAHFEGNIKRVGEEKPGAVKPSGIEAQVIEQPQDANKA